MDKFKGKYRIPSARWAAWDYGSNAAYFITICAAGRAHYFGEIAAGEMVLTPVGRAAWDCWHQIPAHFPFVVLDEFVVMPNHVHGIVVIDKPVAPVVGMGMVETQNIASLPKPTPPTPTPKNRFGPQSQNLASIVRGFKIGVTKFAAGTTSRLPGRRAITTTSSATPVNMNASGATSRRTRRNGPPTRSTPSDAPSDGWVVRRCSTMSKVGQIERAMQNRVVRLFRDTFHYDYPGNEVLNREPLDHATWAYCFAALRKHLMCGVGQRLSSDAH